MGFASGFAAGLAVGKKKWGGAPSDDWQPPDWWIPVPEPEPYDIYILVLATKTGYMNVGMNFSLYLRRSSDSEIGHGHVHCDWGDGTENDYYEWGYPQHTYAEEGQYLIHITTDENANFYVHSGSNQSSWQIFKAGEKIVFVSEYYDKYGYDSMNRPFVGNGLKLIQINSPKGLPMGKKESLFQDCRGLKKIKLRQNLSGNILDYTFQLNYGLDNFPIDTESVEFVNRYAFQQCHGLKTLSLPNVTSIGFQAFFNCDHLESIYLPNCTFVEDGAFENCYSLQKIVLAEDCTFGTNCFQNCYSLYPRPDGSVN